MPNKKTILIIGASGYLGKKLYLELFKNTSIYEVYGTCFSSNYSNLIQIDLTNKESTEKTLYIKPNIIIWTASDLDKEVEISKNGLIQILNKIDSKTRFIYISTTVGKGENQNEETEPLIRKETEYLFNYVNGKILGEREVKSKINNHLIIRPGSIFGFGVNGEEDSRMKILQKKRSKNENFFRATNLYSSFIHIDDLINCILEVIESDLTGTLNISYQKPLSYYDFNKHLCKLLKINDEFIKEYQDIDNQSNTLNNEKRTKFLRTTINEL